MTVATKRTNQTTGEPHIATDRYKTKLCTELYANTDTDPRLIDQFMPYKSMTDSLTFDWYCPEIPDIVVQNDPSVNIDGIASYFVLNYCDLAASNLDYVDDNCVTDHE